ISSGRLAIPDVTSLQVAQALRRLTAAGFTNTAVKRVASSRPKGVVVEQSPVAGVTAARNTTVTLTVSSGAKPVIVPQVVGQSQAAGATLRRGTRVPLVVSAGPNPQPATSVPNVVGQDQATAASTLRSAGFRVVVLNRPTTNASKDGLVVDEQPRAGSSIPAG